MFGRAALLALLFSLPLFGQGFTFEPIAPTDQSFVVLRIRSLWRDGCRPEKEQITRNGSSIVVRYETPRGVGCATAIYPWNEAAPLGVLPAGIYDVKVEVDDYDGLMTMATLKLVVTEAEPEVPFEPRIASTAGGTQVTGPNLCGDITGPGEVALFVDGVRIPHTLDACVLKATLPPHAAGPVDVRVTTQLRTYETVNAIHYVDPAATPDPALYERVLVPVLFRGPGAFGSQWETDVIVDADAPLGVLPDVSAALRTNTSLWTLFGDRPAGLILFLPRGRDVRFSNHIRDVSRDATQWGTEIPIVREGEARTQIVLRDVPFDPRYRLQLRAYSLDGVTTPVLVHLPDQGNPLTLRGPCTVAPCNSNQPAYGSMDLRAVRPLLRGKHTVIVEYPVAQPPRVWAFITVTNNETQHVTVISPQ
ncbi:MAG TPA: hypothetical protein VNI54_12380 [Thermoanaerobaculia bacterium]|nr:hypothetical protein [Thermoanaerobaculia bacterium]